MQPVSPASLSSLTVLDSELDPQQASSTSPEASLLCEDVGAIDSPAAAESSSESSKSSFWKIFSSTFITIFLAEIGDKTQVSTLLMSAEFHQPWVVFAGAGAALVATTLIGVWVGQWLSSRLSPRTLDVSAGILLALISASLIWDVLQM